MSISDLNSCFFIGHRFLKHLFSTLPSSIFLYIKKAQLFFFYQDCVIKLTSIRNKFLFISMANLGSRMGLFAIVFTMIWAGVVAQSSDDCTNVLISLSPCLNYITGNSSVPSSGCCTQLSTVVKNKPECLCQVLSGGASNLGLNINQTQALALPTACKVQTPPLSQCNGKKQNSF